MSQIISLAANEGAVLSVTGNVGGPVSSDAVGNLDFTGSGGVTVTGTPGTNSLDITVTGIVPIQFDTDAGSAVPALGILNVLGTTNEIETSGAGSTVTIGIPTNPTLSGNITLSSLGRGIVQSTAGGVLSSSEGTNGQLLISSGAGAPAWANITSSSGSLAVTDGANTINIDITGTTDHALQLGNATGTLTSLAVGSTNQVLLGATGADPIWGAVDLTTDITGILPIANGGTNANAMTTTYGVNYFDGASIVTTAVGTAAQVLTSNGAGVAPTWQTNGTGTVLSVTAGTNLNDSGTATDPIINLDTAITAIDSITVSNNGSLRTGTSAADTLLLQAYDVDGGVYTTFATLTANNDPAMDLATDVTLGTKYIYRADGTDVPVADGGTGASTLTDGGVLLGSGVAAITPTAALTSGQLLIGNTGSDPSLATLTEGTGISITNAAGSVTIANAGTELNNQTGTSYTLQLSDSSKMVSCTNAGAIAVTVPTNAAVAFPIGTIISFSQNGAGQITFSGAVPPTLRSADSALTTVKIYSVCACIKIATDEWIFGGDLEA